MLVKKNRDGVVLVLLLRLVTITIFIVTLVAVILRPSVVIDFTANEASGVTIIF